MLDVVGIGALNLDFILPKTQYLELTQRDSFQISEMFEDGKEQPVSMSHIDEAIQTIGRNYLVQRLGGSAFNTILSMSYLNERFKLGYIGVAGQTGKEGQNSFIKTFSDHKIDKKYVHEVEKRSGVCVSIIKERERSLITYPGVNTLAGSYISQNYEEILDYLSNTKLVHVTSFYDNQTPKILARLLTEAKAKHPLLEISFDPGYYWCNNIEQIPVVKTINSITDYLMLNYKEFQDLGRYANDNDVSLAKKIYNSYKVKKMLIILKKYGLIKLFMNYNKLTNRKYDVDLLPINQIEDDTGAGDVFAAGFITSLLIPSMDFNDGVLLGLELVKRKLRTAEPSYYLEFESVFRNHNYNESLVELQKRLKKSNSKIFISHGHDKMMLESVKNLILKIGLKPIILEEQKNLGQTILEKLENESDTSCAIVLLSPDDTVINEDNQTIIKQARPNVLYELGLFQGKLGRHRVIVLHKKGKGKIKSKLLSNIGGLVYTEFDDGIGWQIELLRELRAIGFDITFETLIDYIKMNI